MTREEALTGHRKMWNEIADMIERGVIRDNECCYKIIALENLGEKRNIKAACYLCHYGIEQEKEKGYWSCSSDCLVEWNGGGCGSRDSEYKLFKRAIIDEDYTQAAILARTIANLPERVRE